jgi:hypothetical protein
MNTAVQKSTPNHMVRYFSRMPRSIKIVLLLAVISVAVYGYRSNWLVELSADFQLSPDHVSIHAYDSDYHDCKVKLSWEYTAYVSWIRKDQTYLVPVYDFEQWNGVHLESVGSLGDPVKISLWCDEGRKSKEVDNRYAQ